tara:strand:+ start:1554 stop:3038 length:1485 start_codon:yes stop_codon:yes gene_type:complete
MMSESQLDLWGFDEEITKCTDTPQAINSKGSSLNSFISIIGTITSNTSVNIINNRVKINRGTLLAKKPNRVNQDWRTNSSTGNEFLDCHVDKLNEFTGRSRRSKKVSDLLDCILANLLNANSTSSQLLYSRNTKDYDNRTIKDIADYLEGNGFVVNVCGKDNEYQGNSSYMTATSKLMLEMKACRVRVMLRKDAPMIEVRAKKVDGIKGKNLSIDRIKKRCKSEYDKCFSSVKAYNELWLDHEATLGDKYLIPFCTRIFNQSLDLGGRFYKASHLIIPKAHRHSILIDGCVTTEPDFKSQHYCFLYAKKGIELDPIKDDPYIISGYSRTTAKLASLVLLNSENISGFKASVTKSGSPVNKATMAQYKADYELWLKRTSQGLEFEQPRKPKIAKGFIEGMPDHIQGEHLYKSITERHSLIADLFGTDDIGGKLQKLDSDIMAMALNELAKKGVAGLPVHDSIRCKVEDEQVVINEMKAAYFAEIGLNCVISSDTL